MLCGVDASMFFQSGPYKSRWHTFVQYIHLVIGQLFYSYHRHPLDPANNIEISDCGWAQYVHGVEVCHLDRVFLNNTFRTSLGERGKGSTSEECDVHRQGQGGSLNENDFLFFFVDVPMTQSPTIWIYKKQCTAIRANPESDRDGGVHCISPRHPQVRFVDILALGRSGQAFRASSSLFLTYECRDRPELGNEWPGTKPNNCPGGKFLKFNARHSSENKFPQTGFAPTLSSFQIW